MNDRRIPKQPRDRLRVQRRRHDQKPQIIAQQLAALQRQRQPQIGVQAALVEFVKNDESRPQQRRVLLQQPGQNPFRHNGNPRFARHAALPAHPVAHRFADPFAQLRGHIHGGGTGRETARFQQMTLWPSSHGSLNSANGARVVFPAPGSASRTAAPALRRLSFNAGIASSIGIGLGSDSFVIVLSSSLYSYRFYHIPLRCDQNRLF
ncbi:hypothetical protein HMSSN036_94510 [Paenibacillus macerans]|nr:hypothetical protein HMSSN036_94510 [Paenibacillus macerans]